MISKEDTLVQKHTEIQRLLNRLAQRIVFGLHCWQRSGVLGRLVPGERGSGEHGQIPSDGAVNTRTRGIQSVRSPRHNDSKVVMLFRLGYGKIYNIHTNGKQMETLTDTDGTLTRLGSSKSNAPPE